MNNTSEVDLAYIAGLIDGEGCIGVYHNKVYNSYQLRVQIEMCDEEGLNLVNSLFHGRWYYKTYRPPRRPTTTWMALGSHGELLLRQIIPFLRVKKKQALEALKADWSSYNSNNPVPESEQYTRQSISIKLKEYNKRGIS